MASRSATVAAVAGALLLIACGDERPRGERRAKGADPLWWTGGPRASREQRGLAELRSLRDRACACTSQACSEAITEELASLSEAYGDLPSGSPSELEAQRLIEELFRCASGVTLLDDDYDLDDRQVVIPDLVPPPSPPPPDPAPAPTTSVTGVPECDAYVEAVRRFAGCSKLPQSSRDALEDSLATMTQAWSGPGTLSPDSQQMMADACTQGADAMRQSARMMGCP